MKNKSELKEWMGVDLEILMHRRCWINREFGILEYGDCAFGRIKYGVMVSNTEFREMNLDFTAGTDEGEPDFWFISNTGHHPPIRLLTADVKNYDFSEPFEDWPRDELRGVGFDESQCTYFIEKYADLEKFKAGESRRMAS